MIINRNEQQNDARTQLSPNCHDKKHDKAVLMGAVSGVQIMYLTI